MILPLKFIVSILLFGSISVCSLLSKVPEEQVQQGLADKVFCGFIGIPSKEEGVIIAPKEGEIKLENCEKTCEAVIGKFGKDVFKEFSFEVGLLMAFLLKCVGKIGESIKELEKPIKETDSTLCKDNISSYLNKTSFAGGVVPIPSLYSMKGDLKTAGENVNKFIAANPKLKDLKLEDKSTLADFIGISNRYSCLKDCFTPEMAQAWSPFVKKVLDKLPNNDVTPISCVAKFLALCDVREGKEIFRLKSINDTNNKKYFFNYTNDKNEAHSFLVNHLKDSKKSLEQLKAILDNPQKRADMANVFLYVFSQEANLKRLKEEFRNYVPEDCPYAKLPGAKQGFSINDIFRAKKSDGKYAQIPFNAFEQMINKAKGGQNPNEAPSGGANPKAAQAQAQQEQQAKAQEQNEKKQELNQNIDQVIAFMKKTLKGFEDKIQKLSDSGNPQEGSEEKPAKNNNEAQKPAEVAKPPEAKGGQTENKNLKEQIAELNVELKSLLNSFNKIIQETKIFDGLGLPVIGQDTNEDNSNCFETINQFLNDHFFNNSNEWTKLDITFNLGWQEKHTSTGKALKWLKDERGCNDVNEDLLKKLVQSMNNDKENAIFRKAIVSILAYHLHKKNNKDIQKNEIIRLNADGSIIYYVTRAKAFAKGQVFGYTYLNSYSDSKKLLELGLRDINTTETNKDILNTSIALQELVKSLKKFDPLIKMLENFEKEPKADGKAGNNPESNSDNDELKQKIEAIKDCISKLETIKEQVTKIISEPKQTDDQNAQKKSVKAKETGSISDFINNLPEAKPTTNTTQPDKPNTSPNKEENKGLFQGLNEMIAGLITNAYPKGLINEFVTRIDSIINSFLGLIKKITRIGSLFDNLIPEGSPGKDINANAKNEKEENANPQEEEPAKDNKDASKKTNSETTAEPADASGENPQGG